MKIQRYPGKAVDASLSLDRNNAMVELYEANWYQAHQNLGQPRVNGSSANSSQYVPKETKHLQHSSIEQDSQQHHLRHNATTNGSTLSGGSYLKEGVSTLSKYQMTLEQIRVLERETKDASIVHTLKDLNGYKPSTLRRKSIKLNHDWDRPLPEPHDTNTKKESQDNSSTSGYGTEKRQQRPRQQISIKPPSLKRSQTMVYNTRPVKPSINNLWLNNTQHFPNLPKSSSSSFAPVEDEEKFQTVISKQPQPLRESLLPHPTIPAQNCDSSLRSFTTTATNNHSTAAQILPPIPKSRSVTAVNRSKSVRFPSSNIMQHLINNHYYQGSVTNVNMPKSVNNSADTSRHRKISLDIKQDLQHSLELLTEPFENLNVNSNTPVTQHIRQASDSSTSSAQSSTASSKDSQKFSDQFSIPRPRLIVPIHTYARKRRTGNLKDQDIETINNEENDVAEGKIFLA